MTRAAISFRPTKQPVSKLEKTKSVKFDRTQPQTSDALRPDAGAISE
jgi:hypothetical protein